MFRKLLSNLPFNPSLINQVSFYAKRMHREERLRRSGLILLVLAMLIQIFAVFSPPEATLAQSGNDIIEGGFSTREQAVLHCLNPQRDFQQILQYYGIGCDTLASAETVTLKSTDYERKLDSLGRWPQGSTIARTGKQTDEYKVLVDGAKTPLYMRNLWAWDSGSHSTYKFLRMKNKDGIIVMVMYSCGNIVTVDRYTPPKTSTPAPQKPDLEIRKTSTPGGMVNVGDDITYSLLYRNRGNATAKHVRIKDVIPLNTELVSVQPGGDKHSVSSNKRTLEFWHDVKDEAIGYSDVLHVVRYTVRVTRYPSDGSEICNTAEIRSDEDSDESNKVCNSVRKPTTSTRQAPSVPSNPEIIANTPAPETPETPTSPSYELSKKAENVTQKIADANNSQAQPGDTIRYTLSVKNTGTAKAENFVIEESLGDVLEYADVVDLEGGKIDDHNVIRWPTIDIPIGETLVRRVSVRVKNPLPNTPSPPSNPGSFDLHMTNVYGNSINISLPGSVVKRTEQVNTTLPNTGPGETLAAGLGITIVVSYFFARSRLIAKELEIVREEYTVSGGA